VRRRAQQVYEEGRRLAEELGLPLEVLDVEMPLDGQQAIVHHVRWAEFDVRPFVSGLSRKHDVQVALHDLSRPLSGAGEDEPGEGCGQPGCGRAGGEGGCSTCGSGGSCQTCSASAGPDFRTYFAELREQMLAQGRTPLL
jgi:hypothetical protein